jgi:DNA gyrase subunit B
MSTDLTATPPAAGGYTEDNLKTLKDAAHIRQNPGMYVGNTHAAGLHHLVYEIVYNSVDEALAGFCKHIHVTLKPDGSCSIADDGRGIPVGVKADTGKSTLEEALTVAGTSGKFDNDAYRVSAGLHGMGAKAMNALSEWCVAEVWRDGKVYEMEFERGYATGPLKTVGPAPAGRTGTTITFKPDPEIFGDLTFARDTLAVRMREIAFLNKGLALTLTDERPGGVTETYKSDGGIAEFVEYLNQGEQVEHAPVYVEKTADGVNVEVALQYGSREGKLEQCYTNNAYNPDGGTHLSGFRTGLTRAVIAYGRKENAFKEGLEVRGEDCREGLTAVVSIGHPDPLFESQTKVKLNNPEVDGIVAGVVYEALTNYLEKNPKEAGRICKKIAVAAEYRIQARKLREAMIDRKKILGGGGLPGKLMDCSTRNREESELFLVEGDSAGGSAESGRDRNYQAVLPLRGKVLNVERARLEKLLNNEEIRSLITAVGVDIGNADDITKLRYGKVVILTDADVDGQHIRTLLLTFFFRQMRKLIEAGHVFVARPPLYKVTQKKETRFVQTREAMTAELMTRGLTGTTFQVLGDAPRSVSGDDLRRLVALAGEIEAAVQTLERRGQTPDGFLARYDADRKGLPGFHVRLGTKDLFFHTADEVEAFRAAESKRLGRELAISDSGLAGGAEPAAGDGAAPVPTADRFTVDQWHEVRGLNRAVGRLIEMGFGVSDLVPRPRVAGREPPPRFVLANGEQRRELEHLRELAGEVRRLGERGLTVTRFKGLGEMDPEELWDTTLDPKHRTLLRVTMENAVEAEKRFRTLMGEDVEGRRDFIMSRSIESTDEIDYGA